MREIWKSAWKLLVIAAVAGLLLAVVNHFTKGIIAQQQVEAANLARSYVITGSEEADSTLTFTLLCENEGGVDNAYEVTRGGEVVGYTAQITTRGYGGEIEITVGMSPDGVVSGVSVGGANFKETAGLGAKAKDVAFTDRFKGLTGPFAVTKRGGQIDAISGATITSSAVAEGVSDAWAYLTELAGKGGNQ